MGYSALHIDSGNVPKSGTAQVDNLQFAISQYGQAFSMTFHLGAK